jgi:hypothetical protein
MDSLSAFARGQAAIGNRQRVFDWNKAARLIREAQPDTAGAGLQSDWEWTGGTIFKNGKPDLETYTYLSSNWAAPELELDGESQECWCYQDESPGWNSGTKWPESALAILRGEE